MNNTNISFEIAEGDSVNVKVICSKNSCKTLNEANDEDVETNRQCSVTVSGTTYTTTDEDGNYIPVTDGGNVIEFGLSGGKIYTFQKYSGTGNIMIYSIEITPVGATGISNTVATENAASKTVKVLKDGRLIIVKDGVEYNMLGVQEK